MSQKGFTLIELLIAIAIVAIVASVAFVALDPLQRFQDARDASRWTDITAILSAIKIHQVDNGGFYDTAVRNMTDAEWYMIGTATNGCNAAAVVGLCDNDPPTGGGGDDNCVDLVGLVTNGYLPEVPVSPDGDPSANWDATLTGYTLKKEATGILTVAACESENTDKISVSR